MSNTSIEGYIKRFAEEHNGKIEITRDGLCGRAYRAYDFTLECSGDVDIPISVKAYKHTEVVWCVGDHTVIVTINNYLNKDTDTGNKVRNCVYEFDFLHSDYMVFKAMVYGLVIRAAKIFEDFKELRL